MPQNPDFAFDAKDLKAKTDEMIKAISSPAFVAAMRQLRNTPVAERLVKGAELLNPATLAAAGVPLPKGMRITSRYFEPGQTSVLEVDEGGAHLSGKGTIKSEGLVPALRKTGIGGCACGGGLTFCAGAGGST